jgi:ribonuclease Z
MKLVMLGTSAAQPTEKRSLACICLEKDGEILMFDAGEGAQVSFLRSGLGWNKKMKIFVTHMHGDHCIGILGLLQTMTLQHRQEPIEIYGPDGIEEFIANNIKSLNFGLSFAVMITAVRRGLVCEERAYSVYCEHADHGVPAFSFLFEEKEKPGKFDLEKAKALGIPEGPLWHKLQLGEGIVIGGKTVMPEEVVGQKRAGKKIGVSGDTRPTKQLEEFFRGCDYLVFDCTFSDSLKDKALETHHSTAREAAMLAKNAGVRNLVLTHFSARYKDEAELAMEARQVHSSVIAARDLLEIEVK